MKLYNFPWGPYPRRLTLYLAEKGITDIELIEVEFPHRPERWPEGFLLSLNPAHSLPVLDTGNGMLIGQSIAILEYLEERHPSPNMLRGTLEERARTRELMAIFDEATSFFGLWARHGSRLNAERHTPSAEAASIGAERFASKLRVGEAKFVGPFVAGSRITIADCVAMLIARSLPTGISGSPTGKPCSLPDIRRKCWAWHTDCRSRHGSFSRPYAPRETRRGACSARPKARALRSGDFPGW